MFKANITYYHHDVNQSFKFQNHYNDDTIVWTQTSLNFERVSAKPWNKIKFSELDNTQKPYFINNIRLNPELLILIKSILFDFEAFRERYR